MPRLSKRVWLDLWIVLLLVVTVQARSTQAAELVMFEAPLCEWCAAWDDDVGVVYAKTPEARTAPLRRVQLHAEWPEDLRNIPPVIYTPTFVLIDQGKEIGRIAGYPGEDHFWGLLGVLLQRLEHSPGT